MTCKSRQLHAHWFGFTSTKPTNSNKACCLAAMVLTIVTATSFSADLHSHLRVTLYQTSTIQ